MIKKLLLLLLLFAMPAAAVDKFSLQNRASPAPNAAIGDTYYASSTTAIARLGIGSANSILTTIAGIPSWQQSISLTGAASFGTTLSMGKTISFTGEVDNGNSGASKTIDWREGNKQKITTTGSCTLTFTAPAGPTNLLLKIVHEASTTAYVYTYPGTVKWPGGVKLTTTNTSGSVDIVSFYYDGTNYYAVGNADLR